MAVKLSELVLSTPLCDIKLTLDAATSTYTVSSQEAYCLNEEVYSYGAVYCGLYRINTGDCVKYTQDNKVHQT